MENMVCARFHAMILSCVAKQNLYVMSYSKKIDNVIEDLDLNLPIIHFNDIDKNTIKRNWKRLLRNLGYFYQEHKIIC